MGKNSQIHTTLASRVSRSVVAVIVKRVRAQRARIPVRPFYTYPEHTPTWPSPG